MAKITEPDLQEVVEIYLTAIKIGQAHRAVQIVAQAFSVSRATAWRHLERAREAGLLSKIDHLPQRARWSSGGPSWLACSECRYPWPCPDAADFFKQKES